MNIPQEYSPETIDMIAPKTYRGAGVSLRLRTPLHVEFSNNADKETEPAEQIEIAGTTSETFNAIGSRVESGAATHFPVIDVDGGARLQDVGNNRSKVIVCPAYSGPGEFPTYRPEDVIEDVLGKYDIEAQVFQEPVEKYAKTMSSYRLAGQRVTALVLRTADSDIFHVADSTQDGHSHLYIQRGFEEDDHTTLISELGKLGIVSRRWQAIVEQEGMGIVRTPWTEKAITHRPS